MDGEFKSCIKFKVSKELESCKTTRLSSSFEKGYCQITFCCKLEEDADTVELFTIYCSKDDRYKQFESKKNYHKLRNDGTYTFIWYENEIKEEYKVKEEYNKILKTLDFMRLSFETK